MRNGPTQFNPNESNKVIKASQLENIPKDNPLSTASSAEQNNSGGEAGGENNSGKSEAADFQSPLSPPSSSPDVPRPAPSVDSANKRHRPVEGAVAVSDSSYSETEELTPYDSGSETEELTPPRSPSSSPRNISVLRLQPDAENQRGAS